MNWPGFIIGFVVAYFVVNRVMAWRFKRYLRREARPEQVFAEWDEFVRERRAELAKRGSDE